ncbi:Metacaspase type II [Favolaschia claudopus]|uniref:Metacaspase type II n=1 Tax=Favolaschia claudopus TaxID=2862362 RepID=A0AAW0CJ69_9AGAR
MAQERGSDSPLDDASDSHQCAGRKRALLVGIRVCKSEGYPKTSNAHEDVYKMRDLLLEAYHYSPSEITVIVDDGIEGHVQPTRHNILLAIADLVKDVKAGDQLCFHYVGHAFKRLNTSIEEDDMDESLIPLNGEETMIVDHDLHRALIQPLPASSQLVAVLDTCCSSTVLDLEHSRCNRVYLPWLSASEKTDAKRSRRGVVRRGARLPTILQPISGLFKTVPGPMRRGAIDDGLAASLMQHSVTPGAGLSSNGSRGPRVPSLARLRTTRKGFVARMRTLRLSISPTLPNNAPPSLPPHPRSNTSPAHHQPFFPPTEDESATPNAADNWFFSGESIRCDSPIQLAPCNGWCGRCDGLPTRVKESAKADATMIVLTSRRDSPCGEEAQCSMSSLLIDLLRENPFRPLKDVLLHISHATYSSALKRRNGLAMYKKEHRAHAAQLLKKIKQLEDGKITSSLFLPPPPSSGNARSATLPLVQTRPNRNEKHWLVQVVADQLSSLKELLKSLQQHERQDLAYDVDVDAFQNPELSSARPLDMNRPWRM